MSVPDEKRVHGSDASDQYNSEDKSYSEDNVAPAPNYTNLAAHSTAKSFGIRKAEIMADQMSGFIPKAIFYFCAFCCSYCYALDGTLRSTFQTYATSSYSNHSLFTTVNVIRSVMAAASQPAYARLSDIFGRLELFIVSIIFYAVGTVIESQAFDVQRFAGGAVLYQLGYSGVQLILEVSLSDMSTMNWRLFASFVPALPFIINTWISGNASSELLAHHSWSYSIGIWAFIFPLASVPLLACFIYMRFKAGRTPEWAAIRQEEKEAYKGAKHFFIDLFWRIDLIGILFIICVFGFILVPFTIAGGVHTKWQRGSTIAPLVIGFVLIPFFVYWEYKVAKYPIVPYPLLKDRGVWSALIIACLVNFIWYMPNDFMYTVLIVGMRASIKAATRITSLYSFVSVITGPLLGLVIVRVKRTKPFIIFGCTTWMVAMGILYHFRGDNDGVNSQKYLNGVIGGLCLMGFGAGFFTYTTQVSIQTCTNHEYMAVVLSLYLAAYNVGSAMGTSVSGVIWNQLMYKAMVKNMRKLGVDTALATTAYSDPYTFIITNVWGTDARIAVVLSYAEIQRKLCIVGLCLCVLLIVFAFFLRDHRLEAVQSLDEAHDPSQGVHVQKELLDDTVVVNNYDKDPIANFFKGIFKRNSV
ncbi:Major Facilitator Superfamily protein [Clavispora lusitaniae]|uniref:Siderophore iron transporter n=3 Tax=Clavispora lusitaniae TaxID=36911 RepID=C4Y0D8_CLAL4|nr:uncharacterized protein CLUG_01670 [Clavispora lusitaniae ATCC 42720]EEQ37547.1 hypothetical protein CLUG_01670 [Clavispora lusitaniae ATCC 42720]KAF7583493.1 Major Facilitator Superfamily protein [Clavispora lusitaniae]OVF07411.1 putative siderophore transporter [Clavispora lusitaniae]